jgi:hypothetical protein
MSEFNEFSLHINIVTPTFIHPCFATSLRLKTNSFVFLDTKCSPSAAHGEDQDGEHPMILEEYKKIPQSASLF